MDALVGLWTSRFVRGDVVRAHELATRAIELAVVTPDADPAPGTESLSAQAHFAFAGSALSLGMPAAAARHFELVCAHSSDEQSLSIGSHPTIHARALVGPRLLAAGGSHASRELRVRGHRAGPRRRAPLQPRDRPGVRRRHLAAARRAGIARGRHR